LTDLEARITPPGFAVVMLSGFAKGPHGRPLSPVVLVRGVDSVNCQPVA
jgi:hypothetical protein